MSQGMSIRYFRTRHCRYLQLLGDAGVELLRAWFNQKLQERFNLQGYDAQGHTLQQQVQKYFTHICLIGRFIGVFVNPPEPIMPNDN